MQPPVSPSCDLLELKRLCRLDVFLSNRQTPPNSLWCNFISPPIPHRDSIYEEFLNLGVGAPSSLTHTETHIGQSSQQSRSPVDKAKHWSQVRRIIQVRTGENHEPDSEEESSDSRGSNFVAISTYRHLASNCVRQRTDGKVEEYDVEISEDDNRNADSSAKRAAGACSAETTDRDEGDEHANCTDDEVGAASKLIAEDDREGDRNDLYDIDDGVDCERLGHADRLCEDDAVGVPELNSVDLLSDHGSARVKQLPSLNGVGDQRKPARLIGHLAFHVHLG